MPMAQLQVTLITTGAMIGAFSNLLPSCGAQRATAAWCLEGTEHHINSHAFNSAPMQRARISACRLHILLRSHPPPPRYHQPLTVSSTPLSPPPTFNAPHAAPAAGAAAEAVLSACAAAQSLCPPAHCAQSFLPPAHCAQSFLPPTCLPAPGAQSLLPPMSTRDLSSRSCLARRFSAMAMSSSGSMPVMRMSISCSTGSMSMRREGATPLHGGSSGPERTSDATAPLPIQRVDTFAHTHRPRHQHISANPGCPNHDTISLRTQTSIHAVQSLGTPG